MYTKFGVRLMALHKGPASFVGPKSRIEITAVDVVTCNEIGVLLVRKNQSYATYRNHSVSSLLPITASAAINADNSVR
jgi:hypothetical protein